jgi:DNA-binding NarL/FixJ family response regulator
VLSERELEVASLVACGLSNKDVARQLSVAEGTIKQHMYRILRKLGARSRYSLILSTNKH